MKTTTMKLAREALEAAGVHPDTLSKNRDGDFVARWEYFYRHGRTSQSYADEIRRAIPDALIFEHHDVWKPFNGRASTARSSHFMVRFGFRTCVVTEQPGAEVRQ